MTDAAGFIDYILSGWNMYPPLYEVKLHDLEDLNLSDRLYHIYSCSILYGLPENILSQIQSELNFLGICFTPGVSDEIKLSAYQKLQAEDIVKKRNKKIDIIINN